MHFWVFTGMQVWGILLEEFQKCILNRWIPKCILNRWIPKCILNRWIPKMYFDLFSFKRKDHALDEVSLAFDITPAIKWQLRIRSERPSRVESRTGALADRRRSSVVTPRSLHSTPRPSLQLLAQQRNLDWLRFSRARRHRAHWGSKDFRCPLLPHRRCLDRSLSPAVAA